MELVPSEGNGETTNGNTETSTGIENENAHLLTENEQVENGNENEQDENAILPAADQPAQIEVQIHEVYSDPLSKTSE